MKHFLYLAVCVALVSLGACSNESALPVAKGEASVRAINAIPASPAFSFLIEERFIGAVEYKSSSNPSRYDDLDYTFNFDVVLAGGLVRTRVASEFLDVEADKDYTFIISGSIAAPVITLWEGDERTWDGAETVFEARFGHTAASVGNIDVYFADAAIPPALGSEQGTLAFGEFIPAAEFEAGDYVLTITSTGDPADVLFKSDSITLEERAVVMINVFDSDANDLSPLAVRLFNTVNGGTAALADVNFPPTARFFHASLDYDTVDIYIDDPLTTPLVADHAFRDVTNDLEVPAGALPLTYTTAGNIGSILIDTDRIATAGTRIHYYVVENSAGVDVLVDHFPDRRSVETLVKISIINTAAIGTAVDIYVVPPGTGIDDVTPLLGGVPVGLDPVNFTLVEVDFEDESIIFNGNQFRDLAAGIEVYVTPLGEKTLLAGPVPLDVALGDVLEAIIYETIDPTVVDLVIAPVP
ncbi:MAG: DUF4397 domain-containing protein [Gammaproteobacteria bacterium]|jgi:hypothetical protein|nr:DUF4397 domain-containing protein [Gammaproteobacteria bacterium]